MYDTYIHYASEIVLILVTLYVIGFLVFIVPRFIYSELVENKPKIPQKNAVARLRKSFNKRKAAVLKGVKK